jgi:hypothetical protein
MPSFLPLTTTTSYSTHRTLSTLRQPTSDELHAITAFTHHASHCDTCCDPLALLLSGDSLCRRGNRHARELVRHLYCRKNKIYSVFEEGNADTISRQSCRIQVSIPRGCDAVIELLRAVEGGLRIKKSKSKSKSAGAVILYEEKKHDENRGKMVRFELEDDEPKKKKGTEYWIERQKPVTRTVAVSKGKAKGKGKVTERKKVEIVEPPTPIGRRAREEKVVYLEDYGRGLGFGHAGYGWDDPMRGARRREGDDVIVYAEPRDERMRGNVLVV